MALEKQILPQPVRSDSLATQVFGIIKEAIFTGQLQPAELLRELHLARSLQVSQATVREALAQLEQTGLVIRVQNRKTMVASLSREEVSDRLAMRVALEELAFLRAAPNMSEEDSVVLAGIGAEIESAGAEGDCLKMTLADMRFHRFVWEKSESAILLKTLEQLTTPLFAFLNVLHAKGKHDLTSGKPHGVLVQALRGRRELDVRAAIRQHIEGSYEFFFKSKAPTLEALIQAGEAVAAE